MNGKTRDLSGDRLSVAQNKHYWSSYNWSGGGHEWSAPWGTAGDQWVNTIYPRIFKLLPAESILEIAPGMGRWTPYLLNHCRRYIGIDISEPVVAHCRRYFGPLDSRPTFIVGDGLHLSPVPDASISFVYSFDSLVHVEMDCIASYLGEIARVLVPGGYAFVHHSNVGEYMKDGALTVADRTRGRSVTAETVAEHVRAAGMVSIAHEKIQWRLAYYGDCISMMRKPLAGTSPDTAIRRSPIFYNAQFGEEVQRSKSLSERYTLPLSDLL